MAASLFFGAAILGLERRAVYSRRELAVVWEWTHQWPRPGNVHL